MTCEIWDEEETSRDAKIGQGFLFNIYTLEDYLHIFSCNIVGLGLIIINTLYYIRYTHHLMGPIGESTNAKK